MKLNMFIINGCPYLYLDGVMVYSTDESRADEIISELLGALKIPLDAPPELQLYDEEMEEFEEACAEGSLDILQEILKKRKEKADEKPFTNWPKFKGRGKNKIEE